MNQNWTVSIPHVVIGMVHMHFHSEWYTYRIHWAMHSGMSRRSDLEPYRKTSVRDSVEFYRGPTRLARRRGFIRLPLTMFAVRVCRSVFL